jgi:hypothetical protein
VDADEAVKAATASNELLARTALITSSPISCMLCCMRTRLKSRQRTEEQEFWVYGREFLPYRFCSEQLLTNVKANHRDVCEFGALFAAAGFMVILQPLDPRGKASLLFIFSKFQKFPSQTRIPHLSQYTTISRS